MIGLIAILLFLLFLILIGIFLVKIIPYILIAVVVYAIYKLLKKNNDSGYRTQIKKKGININWRKVLIYGIAIIYLIIPVDFVPDFLVGIGFLDDLLGLGIAAYFAERKQIR